jgi:hypothetical protein
MLNDLRQILEEDNRIESDLDLMMEATTDSDMMDAFIDEDGEAEIPESELTKILSKIPEYNRDEELNKRLKRLTESIIPDIDELGVVEEGVKDVAKSAGKLTLKAADKLNRILDDISASPAKSAAAMSLYVTADTVLAVGIPGLVLGAVAAPMSGLIGVGASVAAGIVPKLVTRTYTKGKPLTKDLIIGLLNGCNTKKDLVKFTAWLGVVYTNLAKVGRRSPDVYMNVDAFRDWVKNDVIKKAIPAKKELIEAQQKEAGVSESYDDFVNYMDMSTEEFCEAMEIECEEYQDTLEESYDYNTTRNDESMTILEQASSIVDDILEENKLVNAVNNFNAKHNKGKYGKIRERVTKKINKCKSEDKLTLLEKDLQMGITQLNEMISKVEKPEEKKEIKDHIKWCKGEAKRLIKARRKEIRNK